MSETCRVFYQINLRNSASLADANRTSMRSSLKNWKGREEGEDPVKDGKRKQKEIFKCWEWENGESWWQIGKNGRTLFDRPKPTVGCSANGRRICTNSKSIFSLSHDLCSRYLLSFKWTVSAGLTYSPPPRAPNIDFQGCKFLMEWHQSNTAGTMKRTHNVQLNKPTVSREHGK